jgi:hypothetical protein
MTTQNAKLLDLYSVILHSFFAFCMERFGETLEYERLMEYKLHRPHQSLACLTLVKHIKKALVRIRSPVLPMWSATASCCCALVECAV